MFISKNLINKNMAEEEKDPALTDDDLDALRVLLHNVKGLSAVSTARPIPEEAAEE